jgi:hypothetical protein
MRGAYQELVVQIRRGVPSAGKTCPGLRGPQRNFAGRTGTVAPTRRSGGQCEMAVA